MVAKKKKTVKISDVNKEISYEMRIEESLKRLLDVTQMLDGRIDILKARINDLESNVKRALQRLGI